MLHALNENIKILRQSKGINQIEFGRILGVTKQCVSNWENDNVLPSIEMLIKIADVFGVTTDYLLGRCELNSMDMSGLTEAQILHIGLIVDDFKKCNSHTVKKCSK